MGTFCLVRTLSRWCMRNLPELQSVQEGGTFGLICALARLGHRGFTKLRCLEGGPFGLIHTFPRLGHRGLAVW